MSNETLSLFSQVLGLVFLTIGIAYAIKDLFTKQDPKLMAAGNDKSILEWIVELIKAIATLPPSFFFTVVGLILLFGSDYLVNLITSTS